MKFLGVYDYTVILTYVGLISSVIGMTQASTAITRLLCSAWPFPASATPSTAALPGPKRTGPTGRKTSASSWIPSVMWCALDCFRRLSAICWASRGVLGLILVCFYCLCAVIRLSFFNVLETERQQSEEGCNKTYHGLPVTSMAFLLPMTFWLQFVVSQLTFLVLLHVLLGLVGLLFILDFR